MMVNKWIAACVLGIVVLVMTVSYIPFFLTYVCMRCSIQQDVKNKILTSYLDFERRCGDITRASQLLKMDQDKGISYIQLSENPNRWFWYLKGQAGVSADHPVQSVEYLGLGCPSWGEISKIAREANRPIQK